MFFEKDWQLSKTKIWRIILQHSQHTFYHFALESNLIVIATIVQFLNNLDLSWRSVKMAHCGGFVRKPRKRLESTQCSCAPACCGDGCVSLLLYQGACCLGLLVLKFKCTARPPYYLPLRHIAVQWIIMIF